LRARAKDGPGIVGVEPEFDDLAADEPAADCYETVNSW
jgi:hypothetical protein